MSFARARVRREYERKTAELERQMSELREIVMVEMRRSQGEKLPA